MDDEKRIFLIVGMAGSGKTTFSQRLYSWLTSHKYTHDSSSGLNKNIFSINLDPAVLNPKMPLNEDIRDVINYEETMDKYNLGPNGAITTCLNLYMLNIDKLIEKIKDSQYVVIDTPGQIEAFTWSSPGFVLVESLKALPHKIHLIYVIDSYYSQKQEVFISNMVYAASLLCRFEVDVKCVFNKSDLVVDNKLFDWMKDYELFRESLDNNEMYSPMLGSLALYFEEFYSHISSCSVSCLLGEGKEEFFKMICNENANSIDLEKMNLNK